MKKLIFSLLLAIGVAAPVLTADTLTLKSGEVIEGDITSESNVYIQINVPNARRSVFSERSVFRSDVKEIVHLSADQKAYRDVARYRLDANGFPVAYYDQTIRNVFQKFLTDFPASTQAVVVAETITQWKAERDKVAGGAVKWGNRWYEGDDVKLVAGQIKAAQLIEEGVRLIGAKKYEEAIAKYREALAIRPLPVSTIDLIDAKLTAATKQWKASLSGDVTAACASIDAENQSLAANRSAIQGAIAQAASYRNLILGAHLRGHNWVSGPADSYNFGTILPDPAPVAREIQSKEVAIQNIETTIATNNLIKARYQTEQASAQTKLAKISEMQRNFIAEVAQARTDSQRPVTETPRLATASSPSIQTQPAPSQVAQTPETPPEVATVQTPEPPRQSVWTWLHNNWALLLIGGVPILYLILRWLD